MPLVELRYKPDCDLEDVVSLLALALPHIVAPHLSLPEREALDGLVSSKDIIVRCSRSSKVDVNSKDLEILIFAHDFPERKANLEKRKDAIIAGIREFLTNYDPNLKISGFVWVWLVPTAFGEL